MILLNELESPTKAHFRILTLSWAGWVFDFYDLILFTFLLIPIGKELSLSNVSLSLILGASLAATAIGGIIFGFLSDKFGRKRVLQWTILMYSIGTFLSGFASDVSVLLVFRIVTGLGVGGEWATGQTFIGETFPPNIRGRYSALMQTGAPIGIIFASVVGGFLEPVVGWRMCFFVSVLPAVLVVFVRKHLPESDVWLDTGALSGKENWTLRNLNSNARQNSEFYFRRIMLRLLSNRFFLLSFSCLHTGLRIHGCRVISTRSVTSP